MTLLRLMIGGWFLFGGAAHAAAVTDADPLEGCWVEKSSNGRNELRWVRENEIWRGALSRFQMMSNGAFMHSADLKLDRPEGAWRMCVLARGAEMNCGPAYFGEAPADDGKVVWTLSVSEKRLKLTFRQPGAKSETLINGKRTRCDKR